MDTLEYMRISYKYFPEDIRIMYNLEYKVSRGCMYVRIKRGMYGQKQLAILAYEKLVKQLKTHGYYPVIGINATFVKKTQKKTFCLCVDDFGIKDQSMNYEEHILYTLREKYTITTDWEWDSFCYLTFEWNYEAG